MSKFGNFIRRTSRSLFRPKMCRTKSGFCPKSGVWVRTDEDSPFVKLPEGTTVKYYADGEQEVPLSKKR